MYGHYDYGSHHNVGGSSSQPNFGESFREEQSSVEEIKELQVPIMQKKLTRRRQTAPKKRPLKEKVVDQRCIPWTPEKETTLCKGWVRTSEDSVKGNMRKERGFWIDILKDMHDTCSITKRRTYNMWSQRYRLSSKGIDRLSTEYGVSFTLLHCWEVLKDSENGIAVNFQRLGNRMRMAITRDTSRAALVRSIRRIQEKEVSIRILRSNPSWVQLSYRRNDI
nr:hypothetical protein [Tanacetum cinerariifolium]